MKKHIVFSDVDGTLVHYPPNDLQASHSDNTQLYLPPSKTGTRGVISKRTLELCHEMRTGGDTSSNHVPLVLISGMRTTTLFQRLPYLPKADAYVSESGGRIFYPVPLDDLASRDGVVENIVITPVHSNKIESDASFGLIEDLEWRNQISKVDAAGSDGFNAEIDIEQRRGKLWEYANDLMKRGYVLDTLGYATAFRVNKKMQSTATQDIFEALRNNIGDDISKELGHSTNLGCIDVYPLMSGKKNCCDYLVKRFCGSESRLDIHAYCMCDDDNDIEMATSCKIAYLPSVTSESIKRLVQRQSKDVTLRHGKLIVVEDIESGIVESKATERALEMIIKELQ